MRKKALSVLLTAAMVASLTACQNTETKTSTTAASENNSGAEETQAPETVEATYPIVEEPITVTGLVVSPDTTYSEDRLVWQKVEEVTGINIEWEFIDQEALSTYLASNDWPDFFHVKFTSSVLNDYGVLGGRFANIYDYLQYMPNLQQTFEDYPAAKAAATEINGEMYELIPVEKAATTVGSNRPYVRTDVLEKAGVEMPTTVDEFYQALVDLKEFYGEASYVPDAKQVTNWTPILFGAFGTEVEMAYDNDKDGKVYCNYTSDQMKKYLEFMNKLYEEGLIHQEFLTLDPTVRLDLAKSGKIAFIGDSEGNNLQSADFEDGEFHLDCGAPLTSEYDDTQTLAGVSGVGGGSRIVINAESDYVKEICQMMDIMYATEEVVEGSGLYGTSFCYGMEGKDWDFGPEGSGTYTFHTPESYDGSFTVYQYGEVIWANLGRVDALEGLVTDTVSNNQARQQGFVKNVIPYMEEDYFPLTLFKFNEDEQYVLDNRLADIDSYVQSMKGKFITGAADIETEWETYCNTLNDMGLQEVIEVYQSAYDRWVAAVAE